MPFTVTIPIINNTDCTNALNVLYKKSTEIDWTELENPPVGNSIVLNNLDDCTIYNVKVSKLCCNGQYSLTSTINITTGGNCGTT